MREISTQIQSAVKNWKEQKALEVETAEAIVDRLQNWAKLFGFFLGVPLFLVIGWLGLLGYRSYSDFATRIKSVQAEVEPKIAQAQKTVQDLQNRAAQLSATLDSTARLAPQVHDLSARVDRLQQQIVNFSQSNDLTTSQRKQIVATLSSFNKYLVGLGFRPPKSIPNVSISQTEKGETAFGHNEIIIGVDMVGRPDFYLWTYADSVLQAAAAREAEGYLEFVLSHYFGASFLDKVPHAEVHDRSNPENDWLAVAWLIRQTIGKDPADHLLADALEHAGPRDQKSMDAYMSNVFTQAARRVQGGKYSDAVARVLSGELPKLPARPEPPGPNRTHPAPADAGGATLERPVS